MYGFQKLFIYSAKNFMMFLKVIFLDFCELIFIQDFVSCSDANLG